MKFFSHSMRTACLAMAIFAANILGAQTTLQLLHASDFEASVSAIADAPNFAAIIDSMEGTYPTTLFLTSGDNILPSPFSNSGEDPSLVQPLKDVYISYYGGTFANNDLRAAIARPDMTIMNIMGVEASALGNHEFDLGTSDLRNITGGVSSGTSIRWFGTQFPYLSANLDFSADPNLSSLYENSIKPNSFYKSNPTQSASVIAATKKLAASTVIVKNGVTFGVVGATTPILASISSPGATAIKNPGAGTNNMALLASILQPYIDSLTAQGIDKIILLCHMQQLSLEKELALLLNDVDIIVAGGSHTLMADSQDRMRDGKTPVETYPFLTVDANGKPLAIVNTDAEYSFVGRLVVDFDANGNIVPASIDPLISGAYATDTIGVEELYGVGNYAAAFATGSKGQLVRILTNAIANVIVSKDGNLFGKSDVYMEGRRNFTRTEETNLGNLSAEANLWAAQSVDPLTMVSIKNGGGIRSSIGYLDAVGSLVTPAPPVANPLANKPAGAISQLDIENSLRFNNRLSLVTLTATNLKAILEHGVAATGPNQTPGRFPQVAGIEFSFDATLTAGARIKNAAIVDADGTTIDSLVVNGVLYGDPNRSIRVVTLNFLAGGGDSYPFNSLGTMRKDLDSLITIPGTATFTVPGSEQDAFAEYMQAFYTTTPFAIVDKIAAFDERIQDVNKRQDCIFPILEIPNNSIDDDCDGIVDDACTVPTEFKEAQQGPGEVFITWKRSNNQGTYTVEYRSGTATAFTSVTTNFNGILLTGVTPNSTVLYRVKSVCNNATSSDFSGIENFTLVTATSCKRPSLGAARVLSASDVQLFWGYTAAPSRYQLRYRKMSSAAWTTVVVKSPAIATAVLNGLAANTDYLWQVRARCGSTWTLFSTVGSFKTQTIGIQPLVAQQDDTFSWSVYPNPSSDYLFVKATNGNFKSAQVLNINGAVLMNCSTEQLTNGLDINELPAGAYVLQVQLTDGSFSAKRFSVVK